MFHQINKLQSVLNDLLAQERRERCAIYSQVIRELRKNVEVCEERFTYEKFFQEECDFYDTHRDPMEREFWRMGNSKDRRWKRVERTGPNHVFCYVFEGTQQGMGCVDKTKRQLVAVSC